MMVEGLMANPNYQRHGFGLLQIGGRDWTRALAYLCKRGTAIIETKYPKNVKVKILRLGPQNYLSKVHYKKKVKSTQNILCF